MGEGKGLSIIFHYCFGSNTKKRNVFSCCLAVLMDHPHCSQYYVFAPQQVLGRFQCFLSCNWYFSMIMLYKYRGERGGARLELASLQCLQRQQEQGMGEGGMGGEQAVAAAAFLPWTAPSDVTAGAGC